MESCPQCKTNQQREEFFAFLRPTVVAVTTAVTVCRSLVGCYVRFLEKKQVFGFISSLEYSHLFYLDCRISYSSFISNLGVFSAGVSRSC